MTGHGTDLDCPAWLVAACLLLSGCAQEVRLGGRLDGGLATSDGGVPAMAWGDYAATLPVPECPDDGALIVNDTELDFRGDPELDDPADAGPTLSLAEAITIAHNRPGPDTVLFDETVFPVDAPGVIDVPCVGRLVVNGTCIDARRRGVVLRWPPDPGGSCFSSPLLTTGTLLIGVTLIRLPWRLSVETGSQLAGTRINTDGETLHTTVVRFDVAARGGTVGPGNVIVGSAGVMSEGGPSVIAGNFFGVDPLSGRTLGSDLSLIVRPIAGGDLVVEENVFAVPSGGHLFWGSAPETTVVFRHNFVGVDRTGASLPGSWEGVGLLDPEGTIVVGPGNTIRGVRTGVEIPYDTDSGSWPDVRITQSSISGNGAGIVYVDRAGASPPLPIAPPTISGVDSGQARGACSAEGSVELFVDDGSQGETFLGQVSCRPGEEWSILLGAEMPSGRNLTATITGADGRHTSAFSSPVPAP